MVSNLACLSIDITTNGQIETARSHARRAVALKENGDLNGAQESYRHAMSYTPNDTVDWATYAYQVAIVHKNRGEQQQALDLLQKAIRVRKQLENDSQEINQMQRDIDDIQQQTP
jgi:tetratricopeptide (TPR) repeat protein